MNNPIAKLINLPEFGDKITKNNIQINDIITCEVNNRQIYCKVIDVTNTMIKVNDLISEIKNNEILFYVDDKINKTHNGYLSFTRKINKINNIIIL